MEDTLDAAGRVTRHCLGENWCEKISYEDGLNPTRHDRRRGDVILQSFDGAGRIVGRMSKRSFGALPEDVISYGYDADGHLVKVDNRYSKVRWRYDAWGRLRSEEQHIRHWKSQDSTLFEGVSFFHDYDANGRRTRTFTMPNSGNVQCGWCSAGRTDSVLVGGVGMFSYTYYDDGALHDIVNDFWAPGSQGWSYQYDNASRPTSLSMPTSNAGIANYSFAYDALDRQVAHRYGIPSGGIETDSLMLFDAAGRVLWM